MITKRRKPLTQDQKDIIYKLYTRDSTTWTMKALATAYDTSPSVIFRAIHQEAYVRGEHLHP